MPNVILYTDGACLRNPHGPGGYGTVLLSNANGRSYRKELSGGFTNTTNNRMELMAVAVGLEALKMPCSVKVYSDSKYIVNAINEKWVFKWKRFGWLKTRNGKEAPKNIDLWKRILAGVEGHSVEFIWVKGHAGNRENERCDFLATTAARLPGLKPDIIEKKTNPLF